MNKWRRKTHNCTARTLLTPKAFANFSPGFERSENPGIANKDMSNPERGSPIAEPFSGFRAFLELLPRVVAGANPGLKLANALGVKFKLTHYCLIELY